MGGPGSLTASFFPFHSNQVDTASEAARVFYIFFFSFLVFFFNPSSEVFGCPVAASVVRS